MRNVRSEALKAASYLLLPVPAMLAIWYFLLIGRRTPGALMWLAVLLMFAGQALMLRRCIMLRRRLRRMEGKVCPGCGYQLGGLGEAGQCPECGRRFEMAEVRRAWGEVARLD